MLTAKKFVYCKTRWEDFHCWPDAPEDVKFLRTLHRHEFHMELSVDVNGDDRDVEFILLKRFVESVILPVLKNDMGVHKSCEMMGKRAAEIVFEHFPKVNGVTLNISEDGENGYFGSYIRQ